MFLKEINEFHYSHSEKLGDAFEYLLSFMGSQGDAGQFRTPRHIIDFIVEIVNPQKNETVLDPACGTAGFLISSFKHILSQNTDKKLGDKLNASDRKQVGDNLVGYDISPDMTRMSLVNMYLHQFASPQIHEYDTLSSEDRWNEYYDVILANPPFFSPKGGIQPHSRFGVKSTKAEVLFADYIMEHLKPSGRAGIIVPEGVIFQTGNAYKTLRKKLVEDCLVGVISLPAGVFQPYSGVKTSVLILDKELNQKSDNIFFARVENDGFSLSSQRKPTEKNDLPRTISDYIRWKDSLDDGESSITKHRILESIDCSLSIGKYQERQSVQSSFSITTVKDVCNITTGRKDVNSGNPNGKYPFFTCAKENTFSDEYSFDTEALLIAGNGEVGRVTYYKGKFEAYQRTYVLDDFSDVLPRYLYFILKTRLPVELDKLKQGNTMPYIKVGMIKDFEIPLPPIEVQQQIVDELEGYQKIIDGCRQVVENYKPTIDIDPSWEMVELSEVCSKITDGTHKTPKYTETGIPFLRVTDITKSNDSKKFISLEEHQQLIQRCNPEKGDILYSKNGTIGVAALVDWDYEFSIFVSLCLLKPKNEIIDSDYLAEILNTSFVYQQALNFTKSGTVSNLHLVEIKNIKIPLPNLETQRKIVDVIRKEKNLVDGAKTLRDTFLQKIQDRISKVWGE